MMLRVKESSFSFPVLAAHLSCRINPCLNDYFSVGQRFLIGFTISHATGKFWHLDDERLIFLTPIDYEFVLIIQQTQSVSLV
jgi:hypothetical protein